MPWPLPAGGSGGSEGCGALRQILGFAAETSGVRGREYHNISVLEQCIGVTCRRPGPFHVAPGVRESPSPPGRGVWGEGRVGIGLPVAKFLDISPSPPAPLPGGEGREPANPLPSQREMALCRRPTAGRNRFIRTNAVRLDGIAVVSDQDRIHAGRRHLFIGFVSGPSRMVGPGVCEVPQRGAALRLARVRTSAGPTNIRPRRHRPTIRQR